MRAKPDGGPLFDRASFLQRSRKRIGDSLAGDVRSKDEFVRQVSSVHLANEQMGNQLSIVTKKQETANSP